MPRENLNRDSTRLLALLSWLELNCPKTHIHSARNHASEVPDCVQIVNPNVERVCLSLIIAASRMPSQMPPFVAVTQALCRLVVWTRPQSPSVLQIAFSTPRVQRYIRVSRRSLCGYSLIAIARIPSAIPYLASVYGVLGSIYPIIDIFWGGYRQFLQ